ncbi:MAG: hypothetical protein Tsb009_13580 [Planctomycetaceae bacterium]
MLMWLCTILLLIVGFLLMFIVLLQRGRGGGLAGAFGGLGGQSAFGTKAGDVFTKITVVMAVIWVVLAGVTGFAMRDYAESGYEGGKEANQPELRAAGAKTTPKKTPAKTDGGSAFKTPEKTKEAKQDSTPAKSNPVKTEAKKTEAKNTEAKKTEAKKTEAKKTEAKKTTGATPPKSKTPAPSPGKKNSKKTDAKTTPPKKK